MMSMNLAAVDYSTIMVYLSIGDRNLAVFGDLDNISIYAIILANRVKFTKEPIDTQFENRLTTAASQ